MVRVTFVIDGFNLYHSVSDASRDFGKQCTKWLDVKSLCASYLYLFGKSASLHEIYYFSALAFHRCHLDPDVTKRHKAYIQCLEDTGVITQLNRFKKKTMFCPLCKQKYDRYEEKETDVAIAIKLLEALWTDSCDIVVVVTGDTDLAPAVRTAQKHFPAKKVVFAFPYKRKNQELSSLAPGSFAISKDKYANNQLPSPYTLSSGKQVLKPSSW
jgi:uncharacterized LabA/DUF88 family protein